MTDKVRFGLFIFFNLICSFCVQAEEKLFFPLDGRTWKIGYQDLSDNQSIIEMVLSDEDILNWTELFTIQSFYDLKDASPKDFAAALEKAYKDSILKRVDTKIQFNWNESDPSNIIESTFAEKNTNENNINQNEFNVGRIVKGKEGIYYIRYSTKERKAFDETKDKWINRLKEAYLAENSNAEKKKGHWYSLDKSIVFEGTQKLQYKPEVANIADSQAGFLLELPTNWLINEEWITQAALDVDHPDTLALLFKRPDQLIYGGVAFRDVKDDELNKPLNNPLQNYLEAYKLKNQNVRIIKQGAIETRLGDKGQYVIIEDNDDMGWLSFFTVGKRIFRLEIWAPKNQFDNLKKELEEIVTNFHLADNSSQ